MPRPVGSYKLPPARLAQFAAAYRAGTLYVELERTFGLGHGSVCAYAKRLGLPPRCVRVYRPRAPKPVPGAFPFRWFPPRGVRPQAWRCPCGQRSAVGPMCRRCADAA